MGSPGWQAWLELRKDWLGSDFRAFLGPQLEHVVNPYKPGGADLPQTD
jgi:hypothetical protein